MSLLKKLNSGAKTLPKITNGNFSGPPEDVPPEELSQAGAAWWAEQLATMKKLGTAEKADRTILAMAASTWDMLREASVRIREEGLTVVNFRGEAVRHPLIPTMNNCKRDLLRCMAELGLTPAARAKFMEGAQKKDPMAEDEDE